MWLELHIDQSPTYFMSLQCRYTVNFI